MASRKYRNWNRLSDWEYGKWFLINLHTTVKIPGPKSTLSKWCSWLVVSYVYCIIDYVLYRPFVGGLTRKQSMNLFDNVLLIMMCGSILGIIIWSATGLLGGFTMALIVKQLFTSISKDGFRAIVIGWYMGIVGGFTIGYIGYITLTLASSTFLIVVAILIGGFVAGGVGSGIMYSVIDHELAG